MEFYKTMKGIVHTGQRFTFIGIMLNKKEWKHKSIHYVIPFIWSSENYWLQWFIPDLRDMQII